MKKINIVIFAVVCSVALGLFTYVAPARAQTSDFETQQQLASLSTQLNTLSRLLAELKSKLFPVAQAQTVSAPTGITFRWGSGGNGSLIGKYGMYIAFQYEGSTSTLQSFKLYLKKPSESSFSAVATFSSPASLIYSSPPGCGGYIYSGSWKLRYCNTSYGFDASESTLSPSSNYELGVYSAYVVAVDTTSTEGPHPLLPPTLCYQEQQFRLPLGRKVR